MRILQRKCFGILVTGIACAVAPSCSHTVGEPVDDAFIPSVSGAHISEQGGKEEVPCPVCGNKIMESGEECDDGNQTSGDGCSADCKKEKICPPPTIKERDLITIWPPNHKYHTFHLSDCAKLINHCPGKGDIDDIGTIIQICSDEPEEVDQGGDGNTLEDIVILSESSFKVRAERQGGGNGRVYTVTFEVEGVPGTCRIGVPHSGPNDTPEEDDPEFCIPDID